MQTKYPQEMQGVFQVIRPYLSAQSVDTFHDGLPSVSLKDDLVRIYFPEPRNYCTSLFLTSTLGKWLKISTHFLSQPELKPFSQLAVFIFCGLRPRSCFPASLDQKAFLFYYICVTVMRMRFTLLTGGFCEGVLM